MGGAVMVFIPEEVIDRFIREDVPYIDLTTQLLDIPGKPGKMQFICRENAVVCGTEEVKRICRRFDIETKSYLPSGTEVEARTTVFEAEGPAEGLHRAWKVSMNVLEYCSGIASRTKRMLDKARLGNPKIEILTTRKIFPGTKELAIKAVMAGGGYPHRLGISETFLAFEQHLNFVGGMDGLISRLDDLRRKCCEKKIIVEAETEEEALKLSRAGVDGIQFDKMDPEKLKRIAGIIREENSRITLLAAGGVNESNADVYAATGMDGLVTSSVYFGKPADFGTRIVPV
jgi:molybdenum transport protein